MSVIPSRNSKELKPPPNNINININVMMKDAMAHAQQPLPAKPLAGKKIDNYVHISSGGRGEARRANVTTETLKDRRRELLDEQDSSNALGEAAELLKTKRLDAPQVKPTKRKERSAKVSQTHQEVMQSVFSTNKLKNKQYSRELREMFARGQEPQGYLNAGIPTPAKNLSAEKTRRKSAERERIKRKQSAEKSRGADQWKLSKSVENLNKHKVLKGENRTPSRSKSKSSGSKGSSTKRKTIHVDPRTDRTRQSGNHNIVLARRSQIGVEFLNELQEDEIKHILQKSRKSSMKKLRASDAQNHKFTEDEVAQIRAYMIEKKRRIDRQKRDKDTEERHRLQRLRDSLSKVEVDRKANAKTTIPPAVSSSKKGNSSAKKKKPSKNTIISMKYGDKDYDDLKQSALKLLHMQEQNPKDTVNSQKNSTHHQTNFSKKSSTKKQPLKSLVEKYWKENPKDAEPSQEYLNQCATKIQNAIRGYLSRKHTLEQIRRISQHVRQVEDQIDHRRKQFWGNNSNSIIQVQQDVDHSESQINQGRQLPDHNSDKALSGNESWQQGHPEAQTPEQSEEGQDQSEQVYRMIQKLERDPRNNKNIELARKLRSVAEVIRKKEEENRKIVRQNEQLRSNIRGKGDREENSHLNSEDRPVVYDGDRQLEEDGNFQFHIRMPIKISPPETKKPGVEPIEPKPEESPLRPAEKMTPPNEKKEQLSREERDERRRQIELLKKFKEDSDSKMKKPKKQLQINPNAPSTGLPKPPQLNESKPDEINHHFEAIRSPKCQDSILLQQLLQREKLVADKHRLSFEELNDMHQRKLVSPRSYSRRLADLQKLKEEKNSIRRFVEQAEKIENFVKSFQKDKIIEKDKQQVSRLEESSKSRRSSEGGPIISKQPLGEPTVQLNPRVHRQEECDDEDDDLDEQDISNRNSEVFSTNKSSDEDKQPSFMQPLPVPIEARKIENIFRGFEEENDKPNQNSIISIFEQSAADKPTASKAVQEQIDNLNNEMVEFVEEMRSGVDSAKSVPPVEREKPGFDTNLNLIKEYCVGMCELIKSNERYREQFKMEMMSPLRFDYVEFLASYRRTETGTYSSQYNSFRDDLMYPFFRQSYRGQRAITQQVFKEFNDSFSVLKRNQPNTSAKVIELQEVFLKAVLDVFNQALDYQRPNSVLGRPMPWISKSKYLKNMNLHFESDSEDESAQDQYTKEHERLDIVFGGSIARVIQWGSALCGFIPDTVEGQDGQLIHMDEDYINHIKETRLALMLEKTLTEDEDRLLEFSDQETEVKFQTSNLIVASLILEVTMELRALINKQRAAPRAPAEDEELSESQYFEYIDE